MAKNYDPQPLIDMLEALRAERNESYREASMFAGLDHQSMRRYCVRRQRPQRQALLALADHFEVNPNDLLTLAGYQAMELFERADADPDSLPADIRPLIEDLRQIADPMLRRRLIEAIRLLLAEYVLNRQ